MEIRQVQYFLSIVENSSFSVAADELYVSQSSLSKQIMALEKELGTSLFDRSKRQISLTPAGETLLKYARNLNSDYKEMLAALSQYRTAPQFSILAIPVIAQYGIPAFLAAFQTAYPDIQFGLEEREAISILPALNNHQHDLAFLRDNYLDNDLYSSLDIASDKLLVVLSENHRFADRVSLSLSELADENFILFDKGTIVHELTVDACRRVGFEPRIFYASLRVESILGLVASNNGISLMMEKIFNFHKPPHMLGIPLQETIASNLVLVWLKNKKLARPAALFVDFMAAQIKSKQVLASG